MPPPPEDRYVWVADVRARYWQVGSGGSPLILLHGGMSSVEIWSYNLAALAEQHQVYALDMVGSGRSDKPEADYTLAYQADFLAGFMAALGIPTATLIGNSMGGGVALHLALTQPERVERLVVVAGFGLGQEIALPLRLASLPGVGLLAVPTRWGASLSLRGNVVDRRIVPPEWVEWSYQKFGWPGSKTAALRLAQTNLNLWGVKPQVYQPLLRQLPNLDLPTLLIWGSQDPILPLAHGKRAVALIPQARLRVFEECGHWPQVEKADQFNQCVLDFLTEEG
ncbi:MAG: alpha/beta fold hydrolase [Cyanobacteriota bacterium]|nr:alpha/beta fold hydrolase [Cyanobacteriota bacterium]